MRTVGTAGDLWEGLAGRWPCTEPGPLRTNHEVLTSSYQEPGLDPMLPICCLLLLFWQNKKPWKLQENKEKHGKCCLSQKLIGRSCCEPLGCAASGPPKAGLPGASLRVCALQPAPLASRLGGGTRYLQYRRERHRRSTPSGSGRPPAPYWEGPQCRPELLQDTEHTPWGPRLSRGWGPLEGHAWTWSMAPDARDPEWAQPAGLQVPGNRKQR